MADVVCKLNKPSGRQSIPATGFVRRFRIPGGTRTLIVTSSLPFYWEVPVADKADGTAEDTTAQLWFPSGANAIPLVGNGETDAPLPTLPQDTFFYFTSTGAAQDITVYPSSVP